MLTVVCFKWHDDRMARPRTYTAHHVNVLAAMVDRHLKTPHRFICVTDNSDGIDHYVKVVPLNPELVQAGMCYPKLDIFRPDAYGLYGDEILLFDLDCVVVGDLDPLLPDTDFKVWANVLDRTPYGSALIYLKAGSRTSVWSRFNPKVTPALVSASGRKGSDQAWIAECLGDDEPTWDASDGVLHHTRDCAEGLPEGARVVFFPGRADPSEEATRQRHPWITGAWRC